jgi:NADPH2:quinone reductase
VRALVAAGGGLLELVVVAAPSASAGEALVDVHAISVNRGELHRLRDADRGWRPG